MPASFSHEGPLRNRYLPAWTISYCVICLLSSLFCHSNLIMKLLIHMICLNLPQNERTETQKPTAFALSVQVCLAFCYGVMLMSETSACVFWSCILFTVSYNWFILGVLACFVLALLWYFLFFYLGFVDFLYYECENWFKIVVCHSASSQQQFWVCNVHRCVRTGTGAIARGQVRQKRSEGEIRAAVQAERRPASGLRCFLFINRRKARLHKRVTEVTRSHLFLFLKAKHVPTTSWLRQQRSAVL